MSRTRLIRVMSLLILLSSWGVTTVHGQPAAPLAADQILVVGLELRPGPEHQVVPKNTGSAVAATLALPGAATGELPTLPSDAVVLGELRGPALGTPIPLAAQPGASFQIPPLALPGLYTLDNIRLVEGGQTLLQGVPSAVRIEVIEKVLISQVTARPLTADEIKEMGIVIDQDNFQVVNFTIALGLQDERVTVDLPMLIPSAGARARCHPCRP